MKRKNIYIALFALIASSFAGCKDFLDTRIDVFDTMDRLETRSATMANFANAYYGPMQYGFTTIDNNLFAAASDEAQQTAPVSNVSYFNRGIISPELNPLSGLYNNYYEGIRAAHFFIDYAKNGENFLALNRDTSALYNPDGTIYHTENRMSYRRDVINLNWQRAEAMIAIAYYYSELIKMYGGVPIITTTMENDADMGRVPQSPYDDVVEYIVKLIDDNADKVNLDWRVMLDEGYDRWADVRNWNYRNSTGRFDKTSALAIKARTLLYAASPLNNHSNDLSKWERAAKAAHDVIEVRKAIFAKGFGFGTDPITRPDYKMPENKDYNAYFSGNASTSDVQSIFLIRRAQGSTPERLNYPIGTRGGNSGITPSQNLVDAYEYIGPITENPYTNRDPRLKATIVVNGSEWNGVLNFDQSPGGAYDMAVNGASKTGYYLKKFLSPNLNLVEGGNADHVWPAYRYAEVLLNYAEAMNEAYGPNADPKGYGLTAREALIEVRRSASTLLPDVTAASKEDFRAAVKNERQVELAFEDHRYWDLIRWKDAYEVLNKPVRGVIVGKNSLGGYTYSYVNVATRVFNSHNYYLPFTRKEITNSGGTLTQNPGYN
ncbi:MAG: RagB/SusD family nutrient uptake outer membrane protein [Tannerellaceae bacterium]|nr:RagB/SusD family nutrient uptake outer membrane protein [Tannerellaceae bacterium]